MRRADIYGKDVVRSMVCKLGMIKKLRDEPLLSRMNLSGYVGHVTIFSSMFTIACCLVARVRVRFILVGKLLCTRICETLGCNCHGRMMVVARHCVGGLQTFILPTPWRLQQSFIYNATTN